MYSCDPHDTEHNTSLPISTSSVNSLSAVPGLLFLHTTHGLSLLHPSTLTAVDIVGLQIDQGQSSTDSLEDNLSYQFGVREDLLFSVLKVWDVGHADAHEDSSKTTSSLSQSDIPNSSLPDNAEITPDLLRNVEAVGNIESCHVAFSVDNRLVVLSVGGGLVAKQSLTP